MKKKEFTPPPPISLSHFLYSIINLLQRHIAATLRSLKKNNNNVADANGVKLNEQARESRAICIGRSIKVLSEQVSSDGNMIASGRIRRDISDFKKYNIISLHPYQ